nr:4,5:9,10-diseco-3-hydroxy-5,9, 17-trioxoandrosta-1(10),2-diene-4-oate hydrolase [Virgibacillus halodenitrificans]
MNVPDDVHEAVEVQCHEVSLASGRQAFCDMGSGIPVVLLHGISSGARSWVPLMHQSAGVRWLAWDAPGYGESSALAEPHPSARDYALRLAAWLEALALERVVLIGHSLGALIASAYARDFPDRVSGLLLADPAQGYRHADPDKRDAVYRSRWTQLAAQGHAAYAAARASRLLRENARLEDIARVQAGMHRLEVSGFAQASWMLANDALEDHASGTSVPTRVLCGDEDRITTPSGARALAERLGVAYRDIPCAGHISYIDAPAAFAAAVADFMATLSPSQEKSDL